MMWLRIIQTINEYFSPAHEFLSTLLFLILTT